MKLPEEEAILSKPIFLATRFAANDMTLSSEFAGVDKIEIYFTANRLTNIRVYYSKSEWWRDHYEFRDTVIRKLGLPEQGKYWGGGRAGTLDDGRESYEISTYYSCREFQAQIITGYPAVRGKKVNPVYALVLLSDEDSEVAELWWQHKLDKAEQKRLKVMTEKDRAKQREAFKP